MQKKLLRPPLFDLTQALGEKRFFKKFHFQRRPSWRSANRIAGKLDGVLPFRSRQTCSQILSVCEQALSSFGPVPRRGGSPFATVTPSTSCSPTPRLRLARAPRDGACSCSPSCR